MKCITLTQPWASLVALGAKAIETRTWNTSYRGELAIHSSKSWTKADRDLVLREPFKTALRGLAVETMPLGSVLAIADLRMCLIMTDRDQDHELLGSFDIRSVPEPEKTFGGYEPGRYGLFLENVRELPVPVKARGSLNVFELDKAAAEHVRGLLEDFEERAGILEHEAGLTRDEAERLARLFMKGPTTQAGVTRGL